MSIEIQRRGGLLGAQLTGIDFSQSLTDEALNTIRDALFAHQILSIPASGMSAEQHLQIARLFGEPEHNQTDQFGQDDERPWLTVIDSEKGDRADSWHADETFLEHPPLVNLLHAQQLPAFGGDTAFRSTALAYEGLSDKLKTLLDGLTAIHDYGHLYELGWQHGIPLAEMVGDALVKGLLHEHPVVKTHPVTGRRWLSINPTYTRFIQGIPPLEAKAILELLFQQLQKPEYQYRHHWQVGDLLLWDQRAVHHYAVADYEGRRLMHRISALETTDTYTGVGRDLRDRKTTN